MGDRSGRQVLGGYRADRLVVRRVERLAHVVATGEAEPGQHVERLLVNGAHALDDAVRARAGVVECQLQVVDDRQPPGGDLGPLLVANPAEIPRCPLAQVVLLGDRPAPQVIQLGDPTFELELLPVHLLGGVGGLVPAVIRGCRGLVVGGEELVPQTGRVRTVINSEMAFEENLPPGSTIFFDGQIKMMNETNENMGVALSGLEPLAYVAGAAVAVLVAIIASLAPARRAASVQPMVAMRSM